MVTRTSEIKALDGNKAAAYGVLLCRPDVIAAYPITPQTPLLEALYRYHADGRLDAEMVEVEGEHSAMSVLMGASACGGRTFTATSSQGLAYMFEAYFKASGSRLPIVMGVATRELAAPDGVSGAQQDVMLVRDAGWIQVHAESAQEIMDTVVMAYRIAEDPEILLPFSICYDGFYLSHLTDRVELPLQEDVDAFLAPVTGHPDRPRLDPKHPLTFSAYCLGDVLVEYRHKHCAAMQRAKAKIEEVEDEFEKRFGRSYGGLIEEYRSRDAEIVLVATGSCAGTAKVVVDQLRETGISIGLIKMRYMRPFPNERLATALAGKKAIGVIDRSVHFGWNCGTVFMELKAVLGEMGARIPMANFIDGLAGMDITIQHIERAAEITGRAARGETFQQVTWFPLE
ncbi:MAG: phenylglyoxylate dehydrogenase [Dehalococcoidia bacterium]|nr:phenylglyoxylate dehydrogenase [Dehalococcoidia bacterium]